MREMYRRCSRDITLHASPVTRIASHACGVGRQAAASVYCHYPAAPEEAAMADEDLGLEPFTDDPQLAEFPPERIDKALVGAKRMSEKYVEKGPYEFFPDKVTVELVQRGLAKNELLHGKRYCP